MTTDNLISLIDDHIAVLRHARALLTAPEKRKPGRPKSTAAPTVKPKKKKRNLSPDGRARIAAAVKARWARQKRAAKG